MKVLIPKKKESRPTIHKRGAQKTWTTPYNRTWEKRGPSPSRDRSKVNRRSRNTLSFAPGKKRDNGVGQSGV